MTEPARITVALGDRSYPIIIGESLLARTAELVLDVTAPTHVAILSQPPIARHHAAAVADSFHAKGILPTLVEVEDGEKSKSFATLERVLDRMLESRMPRQGCLIALGGGVVGDLGGFAAATYLRGIDYIQMPTTLLAMVDSSVGGKTGINTHRGKNLVGAFWQPKIVIADLGALKTLPARELRSGLAEVIKHGVIADPALFEALERAPVLAEPDDGLLALAVRRSCEIKGSVVAEDERETTGRRMILNFGHTLGHAVENLAGYHELLHGECVSIGMVAAAGLAADLQMCEHGVPHRIETVCAAARLPVRIPAMPWPRLLDVMRLDKKVKGDRLRFVLPTRIGEVIIRDDVPLEAVERACRARGATA